MDLCQAFPGLRPENHLGCTARPVDLHAGKKFHADAFKTLIRAAVALNRSR